jgi:hypothetical protein
MAGFIDAVHGYSGAAMGMARAYTNLRADSSYTSFRGDMIMTWVTFRWLQKHLERGICDWVAIRVLRWAQRKKKIATLPSGWERTLSWTWPRMPEVDELDAQQAIAWALKNGTVDWSYLLGPDWERRFEAMGKQKEAAERYGLPFGFLTGGPETPPNPKKYNGK